MFSTHQNRFSSRAGHLQHSCVIVTLTLWIAAAVFESRAATMISDSRIQVVFTGKPQSIVVAASNPDESDWHGDIFFRVFQKSSSLSMPISEKKFWRQVTLPAQTKVFSDLEIELPEVRVTTQFEIRFYSADNSPAGSVTLKGVPVSVLWEIEQVVPAPAFGIYDPANLVLPALRAEMIEWVVLDDPLEARRRQLKAVVLVMEGMNDNNLKRWTDFEMPGVMLIRFLPDTPSNHGLSPLIIGKQDNRVFASAPLSWLEGFEESAESQLRLVDLVRLIHAELR